MIRQYNEKIFNNLLIDYVAYDDRHFDQKKCVPEKTMLKFLNIFKTRKHC